MKISIVTPSYNQGRFIKQCIESVKRQEGDFLIEHIICDNCSTDETEEILRAYHADPGRVEAKIIVEKDGGQTEAINKGFRLATGDIVCWLNTDEWYYDGALQRVVNFFMNHPDVDVAFGDCDFVDEKLRVVKRKREHFFSKSMLLYYGCFIPSCATFVRRRVLDQGFFLNDYYKVCMDYEWYVRLSQNGFKFKHMGTVLAAFVLHGKNISKVYPLDYRKNDFNNVRLQWGCAKFLPGQLRIFLFEILSLFWIGIRVTSRLLRNK
ncbi:MAG: glycosyltransferase family 2 protein [Candidatus Bathyarchaeia archaeon]|nr:glycosyltransferase [Candidatus Jingweiarchaeum tengchongense]